jgi:hypothetical protein
MAAAIIDGGASDATAAGTLEASEASNGAAAPYWKAAAEAHTGDVVGSWLLAKAANVIAEQEAVWEAERQEEAARELAEATPESVETTLFNLGDDERALLETPADYLELERYVRSRSRGWSFRIVRGISYRVGESISRRQRDEAWSVADYGRLTITTERGRLPGRGEVLRHLAAHDPRRRPRRRRAADPDRTFQQAL